MTDLNVVMLLGRLTRKPELRMCQNGIAMCSFCIAVNRYYRDKKGQNQEEVAFVPCTAFGKVVEQLAQKQQGEPILTVGRLKTESWQAEGVNHSRLVLIAEEVRCVSTVQTVPEAERLEDFVSALEHVKKAVPF